MFLLILSVLSALNGIEASQQRPPLQVSNVQGPGQQIAGQTPIIIPLFGSPIELKLKTWYFKNGSPNKVTSFDTVLNTGYDSEVTRSIMSRGEKTLVVGSFDYKNQGPNRPSSAVALANGEQPFYSKPNQLYPFRIGSISLGDTFLARIMRQFDKKIISLWWDSTTGTESQNGPQNPIAELAIGGLNPHRFAPGPDMFINAGLVQDGSTRNPYWNTDAGTIIRVGNLPIKFEKRIMFDITEHSSIPRGIFRAITRPMAEEIAFTEGMLRGRPRDGNPQTTAFLENMKPVDEFNCKYVPKLMPLHIGQLTISPAMMYRQIAEGKCKMTLPIQNNPDRQAIMVIGNDLIRRFYFSIIYNPQNKITLQFSARVDGKPPAPPAAQ